MARRMLLTVVCLLPVVAQERLLKEVELGKAPGWLDTGVDVGAGDVLRLEASGELKFGEAAQKNGPEGLPRGWRDLMRVFQVNEAGRGAVVGRIGEKEASRPFLIGGRREHTVVMPGRLLLGVNGAEPAAYEGSYRVRITLVAKGAPPKPYTGPLPRITEDLMKKIPRRVVDPDGTQGDRINFLVVGGTLEEVTEALLSTGWVVVDKTVQESVLKGALGTLMGKEAYLTMPMSPLMVFDRVQDHGFAMSDRSRPWPSGTTSGFGPRPSRWRAGH